MLRWDNVDEQEIYDMTVKMYRNPIVAKKTINSPYRDLELDHYAYLYFKTELLMYYIMDTNWERYMEERGDIFRMTEVKIPTETDASATIL